MQIDWFTFGAQIVNFLILVGLLKRFLYGPILEAMDRREERISSRLEEAQQKKQMAEDEAETYRMLQADLEEAHKNKLVEAENEADERREALIREAREEIEHLEREWRDALERERESFLQELSERAVEETIAVARRALNDLANADLETQAVEVFLQRIDAIPKSHRETFAEALRSSDRPAVVHSAFALTDSQKAQIRERIAEELGAIEDLTFESNSDIGFGIELRIEEHKVAWSLDSYLDDLKARVRERLDAELRKGSASVPEESVAHPGSTNEA